jgi:CheY-like chemotaxis protein
MTMTDFREMSYCWKREGSTRNPPTWLDALEALRSHDVEPQVIALDPMMPHLDGEAFIRETAREPSIGGISVV